MVDGARTGAATPLSSTSGGSGCLQTAQIAKAVTRSSRFSLMSEQTMTFAKGNTNSPSIDVVCQSTAARARRISERNAEALEGAPIAAERLRDEQLVREGPDRCSHVGGGSGVASQRTDDTSETGCLGQLEQVPSTESGDDHESERLPHPALPIDRSRDDRDLDRQQDDERTSAARACRDRRATVSASSPHAFRRGSTRGCRCVDGGGLRDRYRRRTGVNSVADGRPR